MQDNIRELKRLYLNLDKKGQKAFRRWFNELQEIQCGGNIQQIPKGDSRFVPDGKPATLQNLETV